MDGRNQKVNKKTLRKEILKKRKALRPYQIKEKSKKIHIRLVKSVNFKRAKTIMFYLSKGNEVITDSMIKTAFKQKKTVCAPIVTGKNKKKLQVAVFCNLENDLAVGTYGIREPKKRHPLKGKIDLAIVPGVSFDIDGNRLGRGMAYYDNFLKTIPKTVKIALAYENQIVTKIPSQSHDIPMTKIITEKRIINVYPAIKKVSNKSSTFLRGIKPRRKDLSKTPSSPRPVRHGGQATRYSGKVLDKQTKLSLPSG